MMWSQQRADFLFIVMIVISQGFREGHKCFSASYSLIDEAFLPLLPDLHSNISLSLIFLHLTASPRRC